MTGLRTDEKGVAAPLVVTLTGLLLVLSLLGAGLGRVLIDQRRVSSAADLAALAGAGALQQGDEPCAAARATAARNAADLVACAVWGEQVQVRTAIRSPGLGGILLLMGRTVSVQAEAHAGPAAG